MKINISEDEDKSKHRAEEHKIKLLYVPQETGLEGPLGRPVNPCKDGQTPQRLA